METIGWEIRYIGQNKGEGEKSEARPRTLSRSRHLNSYLGTTEGSRQRSSFIKLLLLKDYSGSGKPISTVPSLYSASSNFKFPQLGSQHQSYVEDPLLPFNS